MERIRKIDLNSISEDQFQNIEELLKVKMEAICRQAVADANRLLNIYGLEAMIRMDLQPIVAESPESLPKKPKRARKIKQE